MWFNCSTAKKSFNDCWNLKTRWNDCLKWSFSQRGNCKGIFRSLVNLISFITNQNMKYTQMYHDFKMTDECLRNARWPSLITIWRPSDDSLITIWWPSDNHLMTVWLLSDDCLIISWWFADDHLMTGWWLCHSDRFC